MSDWTFDMWTREAMGAALIGLGLLVMFFRSATDEFSYFHLMGLGEPLQARVEKAFEERARVEQFADRLVTRILAGLLFFGGAVLMATRVAPVAILAAFGCLAALVRAVAYERSRARRKRRFATLGPRFLGAVVSRPAWTLASVGAVLPLLFVREETVSSAIVAVAGVCTLALARRIAFAPSLFLGADLPAEQFVDERLRARRTLAVLPGISTFALIFVTAVPLGSNDAMLKALVLIVWGLATFAGQWLGWYAASSPSRADAKLWFESA